MFSARRVLQNSPYKVSSGSFRTAARAGNAKHALAHQECGALPARSAPPSPAKNDHVANSPTNVIATAVILAPTLASGLTSRFDRRSQLSPGRFGISAACCQSLYVQYALLYVAPRKITCWMSQCAGRNVSFQLRCSMRVTTWRNTAHLMAFNQSGTSGRRIMFNRVQSGMGKRQWKTSSK